MTQILGWPFGEKKSDLANPDADDIQVKNCSELNSDFIQLSRWRMVAIRPYSFSWSFLIINENFSFNERSCKLHYRIYFLIFRDHLNWCFFILILLLWSIIYGCKNIIKDNYHEKSSPFSDKVSHKIDLTTLNLPRDHPRA